MVKGKILFVIVLYITLGVIAFFNFGVYGYVLEKIDQKPHAGDTRWKKLGENVRNVRSAPYEEAEDSAQIEEVKDSRQTEDLID